MDPKQQVLAYFRNDRQYNAGRKIYYQLPGKSKSVQHRLSAQAETPANLEVLHYEMAKAVGITERQLRSELKKPLTTVEKSEPVKPELTPEEKIRKEVLALNYHQKLKPEIKDLGIEVKDNKKKTLQNALIKYRLQKYRDEAAETLRTDLSQLETIEELTEEAQRLNIELEDPDPDTLREAIIRARVALQLEKKS